MRITQALKLKSGDEVFWNDPDRGLCSRKYTIATIEFAVEGIEGIIKITEPDGSYLECYARELK